MKKEFKYLTIFKYEEEQEYLRDMHKHGWKLVKISGIGIYHFEECEPEDVVYQLDYNLQKNDEYFQMFKDCGWEYLFDFAQYSYSHQNTRNYLFQGPNHRHPFDLNLQKY